MCLPHLGDPARIAFAEPLEKVPIPDPSLASLKLALSSSLVLCLIYSREAPCSLAGKTLLAASVENFPSRLPVSRAPAGASGGKGDWKMSLSGCSALILVSSGSFFTGRQEKIVRLSTSGNRRAGRAIFRVLRVPRGQNARSVEIHTKPRSPQGQAVRC